MIETVQKRLLIVLTSNQNGNECNDLDGVIQVKLVVHQHPNSFEGHEDDQEDNILYYGHCHDETVNNANHNSQVVNLF